MRERWPYPPSPLPRHRGWESWILWSTLVLQLCGMIPWLGYPGAAAAGASTGLPAPCVASSKSPFKLHELDAGSRAYLAPVVFEGKARSKSKVHRGIYRVTFDVVTHIKGQLTVGSTVRLEFLAVSSPSNKSDTPRQVVVALPTAYNHHNHPSISTSSSSGSPVLSRTKGDRKSNNDNNLTTTPSPISQLRRTKKRLELRTIRSIPELGGAREVQPHDPDTLLPMPESGRTRTRHELSRPRRRRGHAQPCLMGADVRPGRKYLVFATEWGPRNLTATSPPLVATKKNRADIKASTCKTCPVLPVASGLADVTLKSRGRLTLRCRTTGVPMPSLTWFKDGKKIQPSKRIRIKTKKRRSTLRIRCVKEEDGGVYECRPRNVVGKGTPSKSKVTVMKDQRPPLHRPANGSTALWPLIPHPCPLDSFCLNGGTCKYYEAVGELVCNCAEGYKGQRCENKDILNLGRRCGGSQNAGGRRCIPGQGQEAEREMSGVSVLGLMQAGRRVGPYSSVARSPGSAVAAAAGWAAVPTQLTWWDWLAEEVERLRCEAE